MKHILWKDTVYVKYMLPIGWQTDIFCLQISDSYSSHPLGTDTSEGHCTYNHFQALSWAFTFVLNLGPERSPSRHYAFPFIEV